MATDDNEYPVLTQFNGKVDYVRIGEVRKNTYYGRSAFLAEPFGSRMGAFNYDDLLNNGRAESAGYTVYLPDFWEANQESELEKYSKKRFTTFPSNRPVGPKEAEHRQMLALPSEGELFKSQIERAFKVAAKSAHPDAGGSDEQFKGLSAARDALMERWRR